MATLALAAVGAAVGSSVLPAGVGFLGVALSGATIGSQVGAFAGAYVDAALFGALREHLDTTRVEVHEIDADVNDPSFATGMADRLHELIEKEAR